jgi:alkylhydroperoxidase family enzyme
VYGNDVLDDRLTKLDEVELSVGARAMLPLIEKFTRAHDTLSAEDISAVRALGVSDEAISDAFYVAYLFNIINRMADALRFEIGSQSDFDKSTKSILGRGYR